MTIRKMKNNHFYLTHFLFKEYEFVNDASSFVPLLLLAAISGSISNLAAFVGKRELVLLITFLNMNENLLFIHLIWFLGHYSMTDNKETKRRLVVVVVDFDYLSRVLHVT